MAVRSPFLVAAPVVRNVRNQLLVMAAASAGAALVALPGVQRLRCQLGASGAFAAHDLMHIDLGAKPEEQRFESEDASVHINAHWIYTC